MFSTGKGTRPFHGPNFTEHLPVTLSCATNAAANQAEGAHDCDTINGADRW